MKRHAQSLGAGSAVLLLSTATVKVLGALFKVPLTAMIGGQGMGFYMTAYSVFTPVYAVCVAGLPAAIARVSAALYAQTGRRIPQGFLLQQALIAFLPFGAILGALLGTLAVPIAALIGNADAADAVRAIAPAVLLCALTAVFRGLFEGERNMLPTAVSQCVEAIVRLIAGLSLAWFCLVQRPAVPPQKAAAAVLTGVTFSVAAGALSLAVFVRFEKGTVPVGLSGRAVRRRLREAAVPVCLAALIANLAVLIDLVTVMNRLRAAICAGAETVCGAYPAAELFSIAPDALPNFLFGAYTALAMTVFHLVPALTSPLATGALPLVSALHEKGDRAGAQNACTAVLKCAALLAIPAGMGVTVLAGPILALFFARNPRECAVAAELLRILGAASALAALAGPVNSLLQATGRPYASVRLLMIGTACKAVVNFLLVADARFNIAGAAWGTLICYAGAVLPGMALLLRGRGRLRVMAGVFFPPLIGGALCAVSARMCFTLLERLSPSHFCVLPAIVSGVGVYLLFLMLLRPLTAAECEILLQNPQKKQKKRLFSLEKHRSVRYN